MTKNIFVIVVNVYYMKQNLKKKQEYLTLIIKGTVMKIEKGLTNDRLRVSKVSWKYRIPTIYNFAVIYP